MRGLFWLRPSDRVAANTPDRPRRTIPNFTKQLMFSTTLEPPVHGNRSPAGNTTALRIWLAAVARRLVERRAASVAPAPRDRVREAEAVRALAHTYRDMDPRFADDLYAAADRHERADDDEHGPRTGLATAGE
ncbi:MAG: hypothetical protein M3Z37_05175 [Candidatus Eremiobacteraeota bacterium]|nr:hypothetical protein [Candidatus Eremiobacteraeota bacterium]